MSLITERDKTENPYGSFEEQEREHRKERILLEKLQKIVEKLMDRKDKEKE